MAIATVRRVQPTFLCKLLLEEVEGGLLGVGGMTVTPGESLPVVSVSMLPASSILDCLGR